LRQRLFHCSCAIHPTNFRRLSSRQRFEYCIHHATIICNPNGLHVKRDYFGIFRLRIVGRARPTTVYQRQPNGRRNPSSVRVREESAIYFNTEVGRVRETKRSAVELKHGAKFLPKAMLDVFARLLPSRVAIVIYCAAHSRKRWIYPLQNSSISRARKRSTRMDASTYRNTMRSKAFLQTLRPNRLWNRPGLRVVSLAHIVENGMTVAPRGLACLVKGGTVGKPVVVVSLKMGNAKLLGQCCAKRLRVPEPEAPVMRINISTHSPTTDNPIPGSVWINFPHRRESPNFFRKWVMYTRKYCDWLSALGPQTETQTAARCMTTLPA